MPCKFIGTHGRLEARPQLGSIPVEGVVAKELFHEQLFERAKNGEVANQRFRPLAGYGMRNVALLEMLVARLVLERNVG